MDNSQRAASEGMRRARALISLTQQNFDAGCGEEAGQMSLSYLHQLETTAIISRVAYETLVFEQEMALTTSRQGLA